MQSYFDSNIAIIKRAFPQTWQQIAATGGLEAPDPCYFRVEAAKSGVPTLVVAKDDRDLYLHSKYDPCREAETLTAQFTEVDKGTTVVFYGTGLGYQIEAFLRKHPTVSFYIYEPIPALLKLYLSH